MRSFLQVLLLAGALSSVAFAQIELNTPNVSPVPEPNSVIQRGSVLLGLGAISPVPEPNSAILLGSVVLLGLGLTVGRKAALNRRRTKADSGGGPAGPNRSLE